MPSANRNLQQRCFPCKQDAVCKDTNAAAEARVKSLEEEVALLNLLISPERRVPVAAVCAACRALVDDCFWYGDWFVQELLCLSCHPHNTATEGEGRGGGVHESGRQPKKERAHVGRLPCHPHHRLVPRYSLVQFGAIGGGVDDHLSDLPCVYVSSLGGCRGDDFLQLRGLNLVRRLHAP